MTAKSMTVTEQDRLDAVELIRELVPRFEAELAVVDALDQHELNWDDSLNLGYYRTFVECSCGTGFWYGDHQGDPAFVDRWALHRATAIRETLAACTDADNG